MDDPPFAGTMTGTQPKCGNGGVSDAVTSELRDRQSSHSVKTLRHYYGKFLEALPGVAYPGFRDNRSTLNTKTGFKKISCKLDKWSMGHWHEVTNFRGQSSR